MGDLRNRDFWEGKLSRELSRFGRLQMSELYDRVGDPPSADKVTSEWWDRHRDELAALLALLLFEVAYEAAQEFAEAEHIPVEDWALVNRDLEAWARDYARRVATDITHNTRTALLAVLVSWAAFGWTADVLHRKIAALFGIVRVLNIAITEITRAISQGELTARKTAPVGLVIEPYWMTAGDERVCPICGPHHDKRVTDGVFPPRHPRCRCYLDWRQG